MRRYADLVIRIQKLHSKVYPVVLTLDVNGEQELGRGALTCSVLPWVASAVPGDDGQRLFDLLFATDSLRKGWAQARGQAPERRIRLHIDLDAPELHAIPWELLRDPGDGQPVDLASSDATPFSRFLAGGWRHGQAVRQRPIKVLAAIANPTGLDRFNLATIDVVEEQRTLEAAVRDMGVALIWLPAPCTLSALEAELKRGYHILHLVAHGAFAETQAKGRAVLFLANDDDQVQLVYEEELQDMLIRQLGDAAAGREDALRLIFLASCDGARRDAADALRGLAPKLVAAGVPAVLAMQDNVSIATARAFAATFYRRLLDHGLVDLASNEARSHLLSERLSGASIPVLFMRLHDGQLLADSKSVIPGDVSRFMVPYTGSDHFMDRDAELASLHRALTDVGAQAFSGIKAVGLFGLGGIGKTELAVEYCFRYRAAYPGGVFWINAVDPLEQGFALLGQGLDPQTADQNPESQRRAAARYLASHPDSLLVLDNLANPTTVLRQPVGEQLMPDDLRCRLLFTTRQRDLGRFPAVEVLELPEEAALRVLLRHPERQPALETAHPDHRAAQAIARMLGRLALALEIAGAFLGEWPDVSLEDFRARLRQDGRLATLDEEGAVLLPASVRAVHEAAVENTLREQWRALELNSPTSYDAQVLFRAAGQFLEGAQIPAVHLGLLTGIAEKPKAGSPSRLARALRLLENACLIEKLHGDVARLHPLVHEFAAGLTPAESRQAFRASLVDHAVASLADPERPADWPIVVGQCLLAFGWTNLPLEERVLVLEAVRQVLVSNEDEGMARRAAFLLTRLDWLGQSRPRNTDDLLIYLDLVARYAEAYTERQYLANHISCALDAGGLDSLPEAQLRVYRGAMLGGMDQLEDAARDYARAMSLIEDTSVDTKLAVRIYLGSGGIAQRRLEGLLMHDPQRRDFLYQAKNWYECAAKLAQTHPLGPVLDLIIHKELGYVEGLLGNWQHADERLRLASEALPRIADETTRLTYWATVVNTAASIEWLKGEEQAALGDLDQAYIKYSEAAQLAQGVIRKLQDLPEELNDLPYALYMCGEHLLSMSRCLGDRSTSELQMDACENWRRAFDVARRLGIREIEQKARQRLDQHCSR